MNPMQFIQAMKSGSNPQQMAMSVINQSTPFGANLMNLAQQGNTKEIEKIARNLCKQKGVDFDEAFKTFRSQWGF